MVLGWDDVIGGLDKIGDAAQDAVEAGIEMGGQLADSGLDAVAGLARGMGADGLADTLTDIGDSIASATGGAVDELELGQTEDPRELVRGDVGAIDEAASTLTEMGSSIDSTGSALRAVDAAGWSGDAAESFDAVFDQQPKLWQEAAEAMAATAGSLTEWAYAVEAAQARAADAIARWKQAEEHEREVKNADNALSGEQRAATTLTDSWTPVYRDAVEILRAARTERDNAAGRIAGALAAQAQAAPEEPPFTQRMAANLSDAHDVLEHGEVAFTKGLTTGLTSIVQFVRQINPLDTYNVTHPAAYMEGMSDLSTGLVVAAADPGAVVDAFVEDAKANPFEFAGSLTGDALLTAATGGAGAGVAGARTSMHVVDMAGDFADAGRMADHVADAGRHLPDTSHPDRGDVGDASRTEASSVPHEPDAPSADRPDPEPNPSPEGLAEADDGASRTAEDTGAATDQTKNQVESVRDPVDAATGEFLLPEVDLALSGVLPLALGRRHRSGYRFGRWFGPSWSSLFDLRVVVEGPDVTFVAEDGVVVVFPRPAVGEAVSPRDSRQRWTMSRTETGGYTVRDEDREITWYFAPKPSLGGVDAELGNLSLSALTDRHRNRIRFHYSEDGAPTAIDHSGGYRVLVDARGGRVVSLAVVDSQSPDPVVVRWFAYAAGDLVAVTNGFGGTTRYHYDDDGRMLSWQDSNGNRMVNTYDERGRVVAQDGTAGIMSARYDYVGTGTGSLTVETNTFGAQTAYGFDSDLRLRDVRTPSGAHTHTDYNERRDPLTVTAPDGAITRYRYSPSGDVADITRPDGEHIRIDYAAPHRPSTVRHPDGTVMRQEWSEAGDLVATVDAAGNRTEYGHAATGAIASVTEATGVRTVVETDAAGLPIAIVDVGGATTRIERDGFGRPIAVTDPDGNVTSQRWSAGGKLAARTHPDGSREKWEYDGEGNLLRHVDPVGGETRYEYGAFDLLAARTDPDGSVTAYTWDTERRLVSVTNPLGQTWSYDYDVDGRLCGETDVNGSRTSYNHDAAGRVVTITSADGIARRQRFDVLGRLTETRADTGEFRRFTHDLAGRTLSAVSGIGDETVNSVEFDYTAQGMLAAQSVDGAVDLQFGYDAYARRTNRQSGGGGITEWHWDGLGRVRSLVVDERPIDLTHTAVGALSGWRVGEIAVDRAYDARSRLTDQTVTAHPASSLSLDLGGGGATSSPRTLRTETFEYRADGYLVGRSVTTASVLRRHFDLDAAGRITAVVEDGAGVERYTYDALSNIISGGADESPDRREYLGNLLVEDGRNRYDYDVRGRLIRKRTKRLSRKPDVWSYRYDAFDQLIGVTTPDGTQWRYSYDALGRRVAKTRLDDAGEVVDETRFTWDGTTLVEQRNSGVATRWTYQPGTHTPLTQTRAAVDPDQRAVDAEFFATVTDLVGTPTELIDPATATVGGSSRASLWGVTSWVGEAGTPLRFPGQYHDDETGLHYNLHRYYDPHTARYVTPDPLGLAPSPNPNSYPHNPTVWSDPLGLVPEGCTSDAYSHGYDYHPRIRERGLEDPVGHNFPYSFDDVILQSHPIPQADGSLMYRADGFLDGKPGSYEIALNPDRNLIFHRTWRSN
ncbi:RHS repeat protein [Rhodococcus rhodnii]|uniref:Rhs protein n=2 Tax=Rhodococcus rhodnii TaxID=38312 RepID=R7WPD8_9NOCA|nr:RHS repeat-associated core domain-containing protein [Rhodococcus rhodnii]EOM75829.1 hypothetical protein Rrhod_2735 [Rhodococcus rhodnii LMG 5362]TXG91010.1 RHS repeat protein [Rhodococcus rhodnii]